MQGNLLDHTEQRESECAPECVPESAPDCMTDCALGSWTELSQSLGEFFGNLPYASIGRLVGFIAAAGTIARWIRSAWRKRRRTRQSVRKRRNASVWRVEPLLEPAVTDAAAAVKAKGRVPLQYRSEGSRFSKFANGLRRLVVRPSTPKPAFAALRADRDPAIGRRRLVDGLPAHGFGIELELHPHESSKHFLRSLRSGGNGYQRTLALCDAEQLERSGSLITCCVVKIGRNAVTTECRPEGDLVRLESVDPALLSGKNEWVAPRSEVDRDALWAVRVPRGKGTPHGPDVELESEKVRTARRKLLKGLVALFFATVLSTFAAVFGWVWFMSWARGSASSDATEFNVTAAAVFLAIFLFLALIVLLTLGSIYLVHLLVSAWRESHSPDRWRAGTSACVDDADTIRNGNEFQCAKE